MSPSEQDTQAWHKRFAVQCNNRAWELSTAALAAIADEEDRAIVAKTFSQVPAPPGASAATARS